ncbi:hypothetical protein CAMM_09345 [Corynebacterium ammoniagenes DSM 20306]|uniref:Secreted protein n=1 Tax=Corynebacterium ammoniagenes TaxID=1697 RepID=A0AAV5G925_CORAM|nr:hypothetical protein CAMM_09345 [Corynebacterium ammoniagenes DSM 20306]GJN42615.1 hypothetical protein CAT723_10940 [Corynebacterium ammoniagenes]
MAQMAGVCLQMLVLTECGTDRAFEVTGMGAESKGGKLHMCGQVFYRSEHLCRMRVVDIADRPGFLVVVDPQRGGDI